MAQTNGTGGGRSGAALLYQEAFANERPKTVTQTLSTRARRSKLVAESLADYLHERSIIEETYVRSMQKLQRKPIFADSYGLALGEGLDRVRKRLDAELEETVQLHDGFARKVEGEVVDVLRERGARAGENTIKQHDLAASNVVKDWDDANSKLSKAQSKASTSSRKGGGEAAAKLASVESDLRLHTANWRQTVAPSLYTAYDQADRARLEAIKESLAKYATMQSDLGRERLEVAARVLNDVITWELDDDISEWLRHEGGGQSGIVSGLSRSESGVSEMGQRQQQQNAAYLNPSTAAGRQQAREPTPSIHSTTREGRSGGGGLFAKLAPKLNRNRSSSHPSAYGTLDQGGGDRNSVYEPEGTPDVPTTTTPTDLGRSTASRNTNATDVFTDDSAAAASVSSSNRENRHSFIPGLLRRKNSTTSSAQSSSERARNRMSMAPSGSLLSAPQEDVTPSASAHTTPRPSVIDSSLMPPPGAGGAVVQHGVVDAEGFSVPPAGYDKQPWEGAGGASLMDDEATDDPAGHLRATSLAIQPTSVSENAKEREAALQRVQSQLLSSGKTPSPGGVNRRSTRGRRDVRSTMYNPSTDDMPLSRLVEKNQQQAANGAISPPSIITSSPSAPALGGMSTSPTTRTQFNDSPFNSPLRTPATTATTAPPTHERAMSMLSTSSSRDQLGAMGSPSNPFDHPQGEGLRASLTEVINVMAKGGDVTRIIVTGEVSLSLRMASSTTTPPSTLRVRLLSHDQLEKSAPNTHYLTPVGDVPGEYTLDAAALASASANGPVAVLRYHLLVPGGGASPASSDLSPVHLHPQWKCEPTQTSILISYRVVSSSRLAGADAAASPFDESTSSSLKDVSLQIPITSSNVGGVQTKPHGTYVSERRRLQWRLDDLELGGAESGAVVHKVLARLAVNEASVVQPVTLRWRLPGRLLSGVGVELVGGGEEHGVRLEEVVKRTEGKHLAA